MTKRLTIKVVEATPDHRPRVLIALNNAAGKPLGLMAIDNPQVLDGVIADLQRARRVVWPVTGVEGVAFNTAELIEAIRKDSGLV